MSCKEGHRLEGRWADALLMEVIQVELPGLETKGFEVCDFGKLFALRFYAEETTFWGGVAASGHNHI